MNGVYDERSYMRVSGLIWLGDSESRHTISRLVKTMGGVMVRSVYFNSMAEFLKPNSGVDDKTLCAA